MVRAELHLDGRKIGFDLLRRGDRVGGKPVQTAPQVWVTSAGWQTAQKTNLLAARAHPRTELLAAGLWDIPVVEIGDLAPRIAGSVVIDIKEDAAEIGQARLLDLMVGVAGAKSIALTPYVFPAANIKTARRDILDWWQGRGDGAPLPVNLPVGQRKGNGSPAARTHHVWITVGPAGDQKHSIAFSVGRGGAAITVNIFCEEFSVEGRVNRMCHAAYYSHSKRAIVSAGSIYLVHEGRVFENPVRPEDLAKEKKRAYPTHDQEAFADFMQYGGSLPEGLREISSSGRGLLLCNIGGENPVFIPGFKSGQRFLIEFVRPKGGGIEVWVYSLKEELLKKFVLRDSRYHYGALPEAGS